MTFIRYSCILARSKVISANMFAKTLVSSNFYQRKKCSANVFVLKVRVENHEANRPKDSDEH